MGPKFKLKEIGELPAALTPQTLAEAFGLTPRGVQRMCREGRIPGARKVAGEWVIPTRDALGWLGIDSKEA